MKIGKPPKELIDAFFAALPADDRVQPRKMFGLDAAFIQGNFFAGMWVDGVVAKLPEEQTAALIARGAAREFAPMQGRVMKGWALFDAATAMRPAKLGPYLAQALAHVATFPAKGKTAPAKKPASSATRR